MSWNVWDVLIVALFVLNVAAFVLLVVFALRLRKPVAFVRGRVTPWIEKSKTLAQTGKREWGQNRHRAGSLLGEIKGLAGAVTPAKKRAPADPRLRLDYRSVLSALGLLRTLRGGLHKVRASRNPAANPPGPTIAKHKARPNRLGVLPDLVRLLLEIRRELRRR